MTRCGLCCGLLLLLSTVSASEDAVTFVDQNLKRTPVNTVFPEYPKKAWRDRVEGDVVVCFHIDRAGKPVGVRVRQSSHRLFERPAVRAVRQSRYLPLADDEEPSPVKSCRTFRFRLESAERSD